MGCDSPSMSRRQVVQRHRRRELGAQRPASYDLQCREAGFVVGHENGHIVLNHPERFRRYREVGAQIFWKGKVWCAANVMSDLIINAWLRDLNNEARQAMIDAGLEPFDVMTVSGFKYPLNHVIDGNDARGPGVETGGDRPCVLPVVLGSHANAEVLVGRAHEFAPSDELSNKSFE